ncbi:MAG: methyltransferase domain-containing protein [Kiloniellaceae bacterium]
MAGPDPRVGRGRPARPDSFSKTLRCPLCAAALKLQDGLAVCAGCGRGYPRNNGILDLHTNAGGAAAVGAARALPLIKALTPDGWMEAVRSFLVDRGDALQQLDALVAGRHRAWRGFLDLKPDGRLLCLGCGYGALVESLAPHCARIFVLEPQLPKLQFVSQRLAIFTPDADVTLLAGSAEGRLPFDDGSFDGVIVAESLASGGTSPLLVEIRRVLRDEGQIFFFADNRFSLSLPAGWWDRWTGTRPLAGLARACGLIARWWKKRNGPQSLAGLCRQVSSAGYTGIEAYGLWPARRQFDEIIPLQDGRAAVLPGETTSWEQRLRRRGSFLPAYCVVAQAGGNQRHSSYNRILAAAARQLAGTGEVVPLQSLRHVMTRKDKMIIHALRGAEAIVIRVPFSSAAAAAEERHAATLQHLEVSHPGLAPRLLAAGRVDGIDYRAETALPGLPLKRVLPHRGSVEVLQRVEALLEVMNPAASLLPAPLDGLEYERLVEARFDRLFQLVRDQDCQNRLRSFFRAQLYGANLPHGLVHGDFSGSNIYLAGNKAGILDWEAADFDDLPILDVIGYLESTLRPLNPAQSLADSLHALARRDFPSATEERFLIDRYERLRIDPRCHIGLVYLRWLRQIDYLLPYWLSYDPAGQERYIDQVIRRLLAANTDG